MLALSLSRLPSPFRSTFARRLGDISYGVFLIHAVFMWILVWWIGVPFDGSPRALVIWVAGVVPLSVAYGYVSARFVEQPIRRWARRFGRRAQEQAPATPKARSAATAPRASEAVRAAEVDA
jgi:peptidoglycan/LPS O-acetylase OafA/YrhL